MKKINYDEIKEGAVLDSRRFDFFIPIPGPKLSFCDVCKTVKVGAVQFYANNWITICADCLMSIHNTFPENKQKA